MGRGRSSNIAYPNEHSRSADLFRRAQRVLTDGGSRSTIRIAPYSLYVASAQGKYVTDLDGNTFVDFNYNYTSMIHGHAHPAVIDAAMQQIRRGSGFSFGSEAEFELAALICDRCANFDKIRFMNSGTEAVMNAIKVARAYTGRPKIAKCENAYHGSYDFAEVSLGVEPTDLDAGDPVSRRYSQGTPQGVLDDVVVIPFNEAEIARRILEAHAGELAAVLIDPMGANMARIPPSDAFLSMLRRFCDDHGVLLIADEVIAFRAGPDGVQGDRGFRPDLTTLGKIIGGGFPVGAVAGRGDVMSVYETDGGKPKVPHGGTYNANPVSMAAGHAAMKLLAGDAFDRLNAVGDAFRKGIQEVIDLSGIDARCEGQYSIFGITTEDPVLVDGSARGQVYRSGGLHRYMAQHGFWLTPGLSGVLCTLMDESD
ncbi:MAG: aminotransferase class III-fold pyridoxal phosphate-dependent enzyme, partial [Gammaproteobacteria bacterium]|nr:aminotransferase class III-fold pyridoxal phosphate-dependent enzyme [Gammaproteobacteria bacterium]